MGALIETDLKKIVALSTLRQLGIIVLSLRLSFPAVSFFHLISHAFFKALLFIVTGHLIHSSCDYQDLRRIGGNSNLLLAQSAVITTKLRLCALPFFSAFFSKELVLEGLGRGDQGASLVYGLIILGAGVTAIYSLRFIFYRVSVFRGPALVAKEDIDVATLVSVLVLFFPRVITGKLLWFYVVDCVRVPLSSSLAKSFLLITILAISPFLFWGLSPRPPGSHKKSFTFLWFLRS